MIVRLAFVLITTAASAAWAQEGAEPAPTPAAVHYDFEVDHVEGQRHRPEETLIEGRRVTAGPSLIQVRSDFRDRLLASAEIL